MIGSASTGLEYTSNAVITNATDEILLLFDIIACDFTKSIVTKKQRLKTTKNSSGVINLKFSDICFLIEL